jgi:hypothetical protein
MRAKNWCRKVMQFFSLQRLESLKRKDSDKRDKTREIKTSIGLLDQKDYNKGQKKKK